MPVSINIIGRSRTQTGSHYLPLMAGEVRAGFPSPADDYLEKPLDLTDALVPHPSSTFFVRAKGHSMERHGIYDGDLLIVDRSLNAVPGDLVIMAIDGDLTCKQLTRMGNRFYLHSGKEEFPPIPLAGTECHCWGVVTHNVHALRQRRRP